MLARVVVSLEREALQASNVAKVEEWAESFSSDKPQLVLCPRPYE